MKKKLLFLVNVDWFFVSHRLPIALKAIEAGYEVHLACTFTEKKQYLISQGINVHSLCLSRGKTSISNELKSIFRIYRVVKDLKPDIVHLVTIKPVLYGGILSRLLMIKKRIASISGLGYIFVSKGVKAKIIRFFVLILYKAALGNKKTKVIFQNPDDKNKLIEKKVITEEQAIIIKGSGVHIPDYPFIPEKTEVPIVAMASRLLKDKGVVEYYQAAQILKTKGLNINFWLIGNIDPDNPATITDKELKEWNDSGIIEVLGFRDDISHLFTRSSIVVLPSYREGLPKVLSEAAASGRAVITTDVPGCRDAIIADKTGLLVPVRDANALAVAIETLIKKPQLRKTFGENGRKLAEEVFSLEKIVDKHIYIYNKI